MTFSYCVLYTYFIMFAKLYYWNYSGGRGPQLLFSGAAYWPALPYNYATPAISVSVFPSQ